MSLLAMRCADCALALPPSRLGPKASFIAEPKHIRIAK
jgi:hypothetical protein